MKYGVYLPNFDPNGNARVLVALTHDAENAGQGTQVSAGVYRYTKRYWQVLLP